jgi:hypothetical protein
VNLILGCRKVGDVEMWEKFDGEFYEFEFDQE